MRKDHHHDRTRPKANLKKYIKLGGRWRFVPVIKRNGVPVPGTILISGQPVRSASGTFYLDYYEKGGACSVRWGPLRGRPRTPGIGSAETLP